MNTEFAAETSSDQPSPFALAGIATTYLALGAMGLALAVAPGYASPIFPAAGFAVAVMLWAGPRAWFGIWLGSLVLNLGVAGLNGDLSPRTALVAGGIACGAALQAWVAHFLIRSYAPRAWQAMEIESDILRCLVLVGPLASLVSATAGVSMLHAQGVIGVQEYAFAWWSWWSGDTLGVLVMLPVSLAVLLRKTHPWRGRLATQLIPMSVAVLLVGGAFFAVTHWERYLLRQTIRNHGENIAQLLGQRIIAHHESLAALRRLIEISPDMSFAQFEYFTRITLKDNPDIFALSINPFVAREQRPAFEQSYARRTGTPGFEIRERNAERRLVRAGNRETHVVVGYIAPLEGNRPALGYDIYSEPIRHAALDRAMASYASTATAPIRLVQENRERVGVLLLHPAYPRNSTPGQEKSLLGFAVGVIKVDELVSIATRSAMVDGLVLQIEDPGATDGKSVLHRSPKDTQPIDSAYAWQTELPMADRVWRLSILPTQGFIREQRHWQALAVGISGLLMAALLQVLLLGTTGRTAMVQRKVREQTAELQAKGDALAERNAQLDALFRLSPDGLVAFDAEDHVKFVNPAFQSMTGIAATSVVGKPAAVLDAEIRARLEAVAGFGGVAGFFLDKTAPSTRPPLVLLQPRPVVIQILGIESGTPGGSRFLYLQDITSATEISRMKSEFLAHAAHELRTPLTTILGYSEILLAMEVDAETRREALDAIHRQTLWLVDIINELLDLSRIEERRGKDFRIERIDVGGLLGELLPRLGFDSERWPLALDLTTPAATVLADEAKLRQMLQNLLGNARKYSPEGGAIRVTTIAGKGRLGIAIEDQGMGMSPEELARFGERFWRADTSGKTPGTGLGVAIVREILILLGGSLDVSSEPGKGTRVTLWLPLAAGEGDTSASASG